MREQYTPYEIRTLGIKKSDGGDRCAAVSGGRCYGVLNVDGSRQYKNSGAQRGWLDLYRGVAARFASPDGRDYTVRNGGALALSVSFCEKEGGADV